MTQPIQPLVIDHRGVERFKANAVVTYLLDHGSIDMNQIVRRFFTEKAFPQEDMEQFLMLIGYSLSGFGGISYVSDETYQAVEAMKNQLVNDLEARNTVLRETIHHLREQLREPMAALFGIHPDDLRRDGE